MLLCRNVIKKELIIYILDCANLQKGSAPICMVICGHVWSVGLILVYGMCNNSLKVRDY